MTYRPDAERSQRLGGARTRRDRHQSLRPLRGSGRAEFDGIRRDEHGHVELRDSRMHVLEHRKVIGGQDNDRGKDDR
jgi:hypothetical protein